MIDSQDTEMEHEVHHVQYPCTFKKILLCQDVNKNQCFNIFGVAGLNEKGFLLFYDVRRIM